MYFLTLGQQLILQPSDNNVFFSFSSWTTMYFLALGQQCETLEPMLNVLAGYNL